MAAKPFAFDSSDRGHSQVSRVLVIWSVSCTVLLAQLPGREGSQPGRILGLLALLSSCFGSRGSGRKGLLCTWEQNEVQILSAFLQLETMQMFLLIHVRSCWQFWSAALFGKGWYWQLISVHRPAQNGARCFLQGWVGTTLFPPNTASRAQVVSIPCRKWFRLFVCPFQPLDCHSCPYCKKTSVHYLVLTAGLRAPCGLTLEAM